jgi:microcystin-dependent protein
MANTIRPKRSYTAAAVPSGLLASELAINAASPAKIWIGSADGLSSVLVASLAFSDHVGTTDNITQGTTNKFYADALARASISSSATGLTYTSSTGVFSLNASYAIPTIAKQTQWDTAYTQTQQWNGGATNLIAATARTSLGLVIGTNVQAWDGDLDAIAAITGTTGILKKTSANTWSLDTSTYLTANQTITLSGDVTGSGSTAITTTLATVSIAKGGTGQTTANASVNALLPSQTGNSGKYLTTNGTDTSWGTVSAGSSIPSGSMQMYAGAITQTVSAGTVTTTAPTGWLLANGNAVSRTTYSALWTALGTTSSPYGQGDGSTTFNLPDLRSRVPIGVGQASGLSNRTLGGTVGAETVALSTAEMPQHNHTATDSGHAHTTSVGTQTANHNHASNNLALFFVNTGGGAVLSGGTSWQAYNFNQVMQGETQTHTHSVTVNNGTANVSIGNSGSGSAHNNMQPSIGLNYIIKT